MYVAYKSITINIIRRAGSSNTFQISGFRVTNPAGGVATFGSGSFTNNGIPGATWDGLFTVIVSLGGPGLYTFELLQSNNNYIFHKFSIAVVSEDGTYTGHTD